MIIPVKCFTCGKVLADKYRYYKEEVNKANSNNESGVDDIIYFTTDNTDKTINGRVLDDLKLNKICCRRHMLTHVDIE
jgi:DNA-directed RNA polymerase subunit N (RpoN/RPB10)|tara:strand:+ start:508 stop:741 length:234 start_codon:yes stop_codon:yes gene_type:complete